MNRLLSICILIILTPKMCSGIRCGYQSESGQRIKNRLDQCFTDNVVESRVRMAIGYEFCYGVNYQILNDTVAIPYNKKIKETTKQLINLSQSICSDNDDALDQYVFTLDVTHDQNSNTIENAVDKSAQSLRKCNSFFSKIQNSINNENFEIEYILRQDEGLLGGLYPDEENRQKIFTIVLNVIQPLISCYEPMETMKTELIKKYLKMYLVSLVNPAKSSFDDHTYEVLMNPEYYAIQDYDSAGLFKDKRSLFDLGTRDVPVQTTRSVPLQRGLTTDLTSAEKQQVAAFDVQEGDKTLQERDREMTKAVESGKITRTQYLSMTPKQKLDAGLLSQTDYRKVVYSDENHRHAGTPVEVDDFWDEGLSLKKNNFSNNDFDRYSIKGFNIDKKIEELFKI